MAFSIQLLKILRDSVAGDSILWAELTLRFMSCLGFAVELHLLLLLTFLALRAAALVRRPSLLRFSLPDRVVHETRGQTRLPGPD